MRVVVTRSGGFAGLLQRRELDSDSAALVQLVREARTARAVSRPMPDAYVYEIEIDGDRYEVGEGEMAPEWRRLIDWIETRSG